jgi:hypothetical protein
LTLGFFSTILYYNIFFDVVLRGPVFWSFTSLSLRLATQLGEFQFSGLQWATSWVIETGWTGGGALHGAQKRSNHLATSFCEFLCEKKI